MKSLFLAVFFPIFFIQSSPAQEKPFFLGIGADLSSDGEQQSLNFGAALMNPWRSPALPGLALQANLGGIDIIPEDPYNDHSANISYLGLLSGALTGEFLLAYTLIADYGNYSDVWIPLLPVLLTNSRYKLVFFHRDQPEGNFFDVAVSFRTKLDYFGQNETPWWRYHPALGLEFTKLFAAGRHKGACFALGVMAGKPFDNISGEWKDKEWRLIFNLSLSFGIR